MQTTLKTTVIIVAIVTLAGASSAAAQDTIAIAGAPKPSTISSAANDSAATPFEGWMAGASVGVPGSRPPSGTRAVHARALGHVSPTSKSGL